MADRAGSRSGDLVLAVAGEEVATLSEFYCKVWNRGAAGTVVPLKILQGSRVKEISIRSIDRFEYFRPSKAH